MVQVVTPAADRSVDPNVVIPPVVQANAAVANALRKKFIREQAEVSAASRLPPPTTTPLRKSLQSSRRRRPKPPPSRRPKTTT